MSFNGLVAVTPGSSSLPLRSFSSDAVRCHAVNLLNGTSIRCSSVFDVLLCRRTSIGGGSRMASLGVSMQGAGAAAADPAWRLSARPSQAAISAARGTRRAKSPMMRWRVLRELSNAMALTLPCCHPRLTLWPDRLLVGIRIHVDQHPDAPGAAQKAHSTALAGNGFGNAGGEHSGFGGRRIPPADDDPRGRAGRGVGRYSLSVLSQQAGIDGRDGRASS